MVSRLDIVYVVHRTTRHIHAPTEQDMKISRLILRYLAGTAGLGLHMKGTAGCGNVMLNSYIDAEFAADNSTGNSVSWELVLVE